VALPEPSPFPVKGLFPPAITLFDGILGVCRGRWKVCHEYKYIPLSAHSLHLGVGQQTPAWIVTNLEIVSEDVPSDQTKLGPGSPIRLYNYSLSQMNSQFENLWLFGTLEKMIWREPRYHIFAIKPHLFTITQRPFIVHYSHTYIAIPMQFIHDQGQLQIIYSSIHLPWASNELEKSCCHLCNLGRIIGVGGILSRGRLISGRMD
jgi:hypothetical protein